MTMRTYEGFPEGIGDDFCDGVRRTPSQYNTTCRALAAEVMALRKELRHERELREGLDRQRRLDDEIAGSLMLLASTGDAEMFLASLKLVVGGAFMSGRMSERKS